MASTSMCLANQCPLRFQPPGWAHHQPHGPQPSAGLCREGESPGGLLRATGRLLLSQCHHPDQALGRDRGLGSKGGHEGEGSGRESAMGHGQWAEQHGRHRWAFGITSGGIVFAVGY